MNITINPVVLVLITTGSALLGVLITSIFNLLSTRLAKSSEERKHQKELIVKAAIENWKHSYELMKTSGKSGRMAPLDVFLFHMVKVSEILFDPTTTIDNVKQRIAAADEFIDIVSSTSKEPTRI